MGAKAPQPAPHASTKPAPPNAVPPRGGSGLMPPPPSVHSDNFREALGDELRENAEDDPCMPIRNLAGHIVSCNYGDWPDFSKCQCAEGLVSTPEKQTAVSVSPMPLRDMFAQSIFVSDELASDLAFSIRKERTRRQKVQPVAEALGVTDETPLTIVELTDARAKIRYLEADAMCTWRRESLRIQAEAEAKAREGVKPEAEPSGIVTPGARVCRCGHGVNAHDQNNRSQLLSCTQCGCTAWGEADAPRIIKP